MSEVKVNKISPRAACGTVQLGDSGDTFTIPAGASITNSGTASGFGATGSASWNTTVKTGDFTAVVGEGYFVNTTSGEIDVTLPAGTAGAVVAVADYANTADTNNIILKQNGSDKIEGSTDDFVVNQEGVSLTLVFVDSTKGWIITDTGNSSDAFGPAYVTATGGTITTVGDFKIHQFTGPGTFTVSCAGNPSGSTQVDYMVVAGGGAGGHYSGIGGGGAGGVRLGSICAQPSLPIRAPGYAVSAQAYSITIGAGGASTNYPTHNATRAPNGSPSSGLGFTATGGGGGARGDASPVPQEGAQTGGSGGGGAFSSGAGAAGNTPPVSPSQGFPGGTGAPGCGNCSGGGGGGGAAAVGGNAPGGTAIGGTGGAGINVAPVFGAAPQPFYIANQSGNAGLTACGQFAGGAGGSVYTGSPGPGGVGGGANGAVNSEGAGKNGTTNSGGGGAGTQSLPSASGAGGSGIVLIRYKFQN